MREVKQLDEQLASAEAQRTQENTLMSPEEVMALKREEAVMQAEVRFGSAAHAREGKSQLVHLASLCSNAKPQQINSLIHVVEVSIWGLSESFHHIKRLRASLQVISSFRKRKCQPGHSDISRDGCFSKCKALSHGKLRLCNQGLPRECFKMCSCTAKDWRHLVSPCTSFRLVAQHAAADCTQN